MGSSARVAAAAAASQAGAALGQAVGHQTGNDASLRTLITVVSSQHLLVQVRWEAAGPLSFFVLGSEVRSEDLVNCFQILTKVLFGH